MPPIEPTKPEEQEAVSQIQLPKHQAGQRTLPEGQQELLDKINIGSAIIVAGATLIGAAEMSLPILGIATIAGAASAFSKLWSSTYSQKQRAEPKTDVPPHSQASANLNLTAIAGELSQLRLVARNAATETEHDEALGAMASAESAARRGDEKLTLQHLLKVNKWGLDLAKLMGLSVVTKVIEQAMEE